jgi:hypothetical protein
VRDRNKEFEEMKFRQRGHESEDPVDFFQQRAQYHSFIFSDGDDGPTAVSRLIRTQPADWNKEINERLCPTIDSLMAVAQHSQTALMSIWLLSTKVDQLLSKSSAPSAAPRVRFRPRAHAADVEVEEEEEHEGKEEEEDKTALAVDRRRAPRTGNSREAGPSRPDWPGGKTINGYTFARDDSKISVRPPNGECYICTSPKHVARDCSHYGKWTVLKQALLIHVDIDPAEEEKERLEYLAILVESKVSSSAYSSDGSESPELSKNVLVVDALDCEAKAAHIEYRGFNRNRR